MKYNELNDFYMFCDKDFSVSEFLFEEVVPRVIYNLNNPDNSDKIFVHDSDFTTLNEAAIFKIKKLVEEEIGWYCWEISYIIADLIYRSVVNVGENRFMLEEHFGHEYEDWNDIYPDGIPSDEYAGTGNISSRKPYKFD